MAAPERFGEKMGRTVTGESGRQGEEGIMAEVSGGLDRSGGGGCAKMRRTGGAGFAATALWEE